MKISAFCLIFILAIFGCSAALGPSESQMDAWKGAHYSELVRTWGAPEKIIGDGQKGKIAVYIERSEHYNPEFHTVTKNQKQYLFFIDKDGFVYDWRIIR